MDVDGLDHVDWVALTLVVLQAALLYLISRKAETLSGPKLLEAAQAVRKQRDALATKDGRSVSFDDLTPSQRTKLDRVKLAYEREGGELDELWQPFLLRFLVGCEWNEEDTLKKLLPTVAWRRDGGATRVRNKIKSGWKLGRHEGLVRMFSTLSVAVRHRRTFTGDLLTIADIGSLEPDLWLDRVSAEDFADVCLHLFEYLSYQADLISVAEGRLVRQALCVIGALILDGGPYCCTVPALTLPRTSHLSPLTSHRRPRPRPRPRPQNP